MSRRKFFMFGALLAAAPAEIIAPSTWPAADLTLTGDYWLHGVLYGVPLPDFTTSLFVARMKVKLCSVLVVR